MDVHSHWRKLTTALAAQGRVTPVMLLLIGGGCLAAMLALASRGDADALVSLSPGQEFTAAEFRGIQAKWSSAGLKEAAFEGGVIRVPSEKLAEYRAALPAGGETASRPHWADVWQSASERLGQFSGSRQHEAAREISRAQVVSRLLEELPDIAAADIVWDESESSGWRRPERVRATVYLQAEPGCSLGPDVVDAVRRAVAGSKANLAPQDVVVMDQTRMVTYDGAAVSPEASRTAHLAALYRGRLETAFEYIAGLRVQVHVDGAPHDPVQPAPVAVAVAIPEEAIRTLARLDGEDAAADAMLADQRRQVFQKVEEHLRQSIQSKAALLIPAGLTLAAPDKLLIETIPSPNPRIARDDRTFESAAGDWLRENALAVVAVICGFGAAAMLRPRPASAPHQPAQSIDAGVEPSHASQASASVLAGSTLLRGVAAADVPPALVVAESASPAGPSPIEQDAAERKDVPAADALHAALARLEQERLAEGSIDAPPPPRPGIAPQDAGPRVFATRFSRDPANGPGDEPGSLEDLLSDHPSRVAELVRRIDVTTWSRALFGASPALSSRILPCLPPEDERRLAQELRSGRPLRLRDIDAAQAEVRAAWSELRQGLPQIDLAHAGHAVEGRAA